MDELMNFAEILHGKTGIRACAHFYVAEYLGKWHTVIGVPSVILAVLVAAAIWAPLQEFLGWSSELSVLVTGILATFSALFTALLAFLKLSENMEQHMHTALLYDALKSNIELFLAKLKDKDESHYQEMLSEVEELLKVFNSIGLERRKLTNRQYNIGKKRYEELHGIKVTKKRPDISVQE